MRAYMLERS